ncbi:GNAT family N-acetyltransferase [Paenibacillus turpanensis]|uniref:GNAT family N-acetyltransferase n=1 Tax=Paenibacillus turpanensis TaxID=2689078 RepID=UPI00140D74CA|nr:GNAT family N-acetyltransferase [Paenibacillus turpanensis]
MSTFHIQRLDSLSNEAVEKTAQLFTDCFMQELCTSLRIPPHSMAKTFSHSFVKDHYFVCMEGETILGIGAVSTLHGRSHRLDKNWLRRELGYIRGGFVYNAMREELEHPLPLTAHQAYIESIATAEHARGKGVATTLMNFLMGTHSHHEFILEVMDRNEKAIRLYEHLGFTVFRKKKAGFFLRLGGIRERIYMLKRNENHTITGNE